MRRDSCFWTRITRKGRKKHGSKITDDFRSVLFPAFPRNPRPQTRLPNANLHLQEALRIENYPPPNLPRPFEFPGLYARMEFSSRKIVMIGGSLLICSRAR